MGVKTFRRKPFARHASVVYGYTLDEDGLQTFWVELYDWDRAAQRPVFRSGRSVPLGGEGEVLLEAIVAARKLVNGPLEGAVQPSLFP